MINLKTALKLTDIADNEKVYLRHAGQIFFSEYKHLTKKEITNKYDLQRTIIVEIRPLFYCRDYAGLLFTIKD